MCLNPEMFPIQLASHLPNTSKEKMFLEKACRAGRCMAPSRDGLAAMCLCTTAVAFSSSILSAEEEETFNTNPWES